MPAEVKFDVAVEQFRALGIMNTTVTMTPASTDPTLEKVAKLDGSYYIQVKKKPTGHKDDKAPEIKLTFVLNDARYLFAGIVFSKRSAMPFQPISVADPNVRGKGSFPSVEITTPAPGVSQMTVTNMRDQKASFDYSIILQDVESGLIGCIDPEIVNEN